MKLSKKLCITAKKSFSLVLALTLMLSICAVSGMSLNVFAATSLDQKIYINLNKNKEWNGFSSVTCRFAQDDGTVLKTEKVSKDPSSGVFEATAPSGATKIELSSGVNFTLPDKTVAKDFRRIYLYNSNNTYNEAYAYSWVNDTDFNAEWPGVAMTKTSSDSNYYYVDVKSSHKNVIFSNKGETQTSDLGINDSYSADNALYDASKSQWTNPFIKTIDISGASGDTEFYLTTDGSFKESKYLSVQAPDKQSKATYKTVYVSNDDWKSLTKVYATFDYNDAYEGTVELTKDTIDTKVSGSVVFKGEIPAGALLRFHPNEHNLNGASSATSYPTDSGYDDSGYSENTATYVKTARGESWTKFSEIGNVDYNAVVENSFSNNPNIVGVDATYFDYWSDMEQEKGYLQCQGNGNMYDYWYQFDSFNSYISNIALNYKSDWKYPLYFGNMYKGNEHYGTFETHAKGLTNINNYDDNYYYAVNNSNGMYWQMGSNDKKYYTYSLLGLMNNKLDSKGNLQILDGVKAPYFDAEALSTATYNGARVANVYKSSFPFRTTTDDAGVTTYEFTSKNAADNIYFTWDGLTPKKINYGAGKNYGINDDLGSFSGTNGYGVFPFNNTTATSSGKGTNSNLDYGFGIRLDIDFRVPKDGLLADNKPATFNFSGDDDLWVYIGEDSTGADAELALDLGGDHKEASGSINFNTMKATADNVFADYSTPSSTSSSSTTVTVPSDEFWVKTGNYTDFCLYVWQDTSVGTLNNEKYYVKPYEVSDGFYKFKKSDLGNNINAIFCKWQNINDGKLTKELTLSDLYGKMWNGDGTPYSADVSSHPTNLGTVTKTINNGTKLDPNKTYHMVVFYMERGEAESNFSVNFTMTPANNDLKVTKALDTGDVVSEISDDLKANETFGYTIKENGNDTSGKGYKLTKSDESTSSETLSNSGFTLKDDYMADFDNSFKTGNNMKVNESTDSSNLKYTTNWELVNNRVGSTIKDGSTTNSAFKLVDPDDDSAYAQLQLDYTNKIVTAPLEISKSVVDEDGTTDYDTSEQFTFAIALDFDGDGSTYDYKTYPLEYQLKEKGASDYSSTVYRTSSDGSFTIKKGESIKLLNIPVGATYKITEKTVTGYIPYKVGDQSFDGTFVGTLAEAGNALDFINKVNPTNFAVSVNKTLDGQAYSGSKFVYTLTGLESMDTGKQDTDGNTIKTNSTALVSKKSATPDASGKVEFKDLSLVSVGVYRFKITEALVEGVNASDYKMDTNTWLAEIEFLEGGEVKGPKYIKVKSSDIEGKTDAQLADYFNNSPSVEKAVFENETTHGSATVNKTNQAGGNVSDTEFAVMKVSGENIFTADDINTIIEDDTMKTHMTSKKTDSNGKAEFDNLTIFKDGQGEFTKTNGNVVWSESSDNYITGTSTYQTYCLFEYKPSEGYTPNYTLSYFTLPVEGKYDVTYDYVDGAITMPSASGDGMNGYFVLGLSVAGLAVTMFTGYAIYYGKGRKKRRARCRK